MDKVTSVQGKEILDVLTGNDLVLLNGRCIGDLLGNFTSFQYNGSSTIDLGWLSEKMISKVLLFRVHSLSPISDHCPISLVLNCCFKAIPKGTLNPPLPKFKWDERSSLVFVEALNSESVQLQLVAFENTEFESTTVATAAFNNIIISAAKKSLILCKPKQRGTHHI